MASSGKNTTTGYLIPTAQPRKYPMSSIIQAKQVIFRNAHTYISCVYTFHIHINITYTHYILNISIHILNTLHIYIYIIYTNAYNDRDKRGHVVE